MNKAEIKAAALREAKADLEGRGEELATEKARAEGREVASRTIAKAIASLHLLVKAEVEKPADKRMFEEDVGNVIRGYIATAQKIASDAATLAGQERASFAGAISESARSIAALEKKATSESNKKTRAQKEADMEAERKADAKRRPKKKAAKKKAKKKAAKKRGRNTR